MAKPFSRKVNVGLTTTVLVGPNPRRKGLLLSAPSANRISIGVGEDAVLDTGLTLQSTNYPFLLTEDNCGMDVSQQINAIASVATDLGFVELVNP